MDKRKSRALIGIFAAVVVLVVAAFALFSGSDVQPAEQMKSNYTSSMRYY